MWPSVPVSSHRRPSLEERSLCRQARSCVRRKKRRGWANHTMHWTLPLQCAYLLLFCSPAQVTRLRPHPWRGRKVSSETLGVGCMVGILWKLIQSMIVLVTDTPFLHTKYSCAVLQQPFFSFVFLRASLLLQAGCTQPAPERYSTCRLL